MRLLNISFAAVGRYHLKAQSRVIELLCFNMSLQSDAAEPTRNEIIGLMADTKLRGLDRQQPIRIVKALERLDAAITEAQAGARHQILHRA